MAWYYVLNGETHGPLAEMEIHSLREQNLLTEDTPVWTEGLAEWVPFQQSALNVANALPVLPHLTQTCAECGKLFPESDLLQYENSWVCPTCKPIFFQRIREGVAPKGTLNYATVGTRFVAVFIDGIICSCVTIPTMFIPLWMGYPDGMASGEPGWLVALTLFVSYFFPFAYDIFFTGGYGATPGKMIMKLKVVRPDGSRISYGLAVGRYFSKILSGLILYIGYFMAFGDEEHRALHDRICHTRVISVNPS